jgi:hypothetical protein
MAPAKALEGTLDLKLGTPSKCLTMNLETHFGQMARAKQKFCAASTRFGMPGHTPRHAMAPTQAPERTLDLKLGTPSKCLIMNLETHFGQMERAKQKFVRRRLVLACHDKH